MEREALKLALEALKWSKPREGAEITHSEAIATIESALAQPAQEPVSFPCCGYTDANAIRWNQFNGVVQCHMCGQVYTVAQPAQEPAAWVERIGGGVSYDLYHEAARKLPEGVKFDLYTAPPQREWNAALDEAASRIGEIKGFGQATQDSFAVFIRGLKR